jgi:hypothetical protein
MEAHDVKSPRIPHRRFKNQQDMESLPHQIGSTQKKQLHCHIKQYIRPHLGDNRQRGQGKSSRILEEAL